MVFGFVELTPDGLCPVRFWTTVGFCPDTMWNVCFGMDISQTIFHVTIFIRYTLYFQALTTSGQRMNSQCGMPCPDHYDVAECPDIRVKWEEGVSENYDQTRRWVACAGGVLKEVFKTESTCLADDNCAKQSCSSSAGLQERQFDAITSEADEPRIDVEQPDDIHNSIIPVFLAQPVQDPGSLGTHILLHKCDLCCQIFSSSGSLQHHATLHIDDRPSILEFSKDRTPVRSRIRVQRAVDRLPLRVILKSIAYRIQA